MKWSIGKIASKRAILTPNRVALIYEGVPITYLALNNEVNRVSHFFLKRGLKKGDRIAVVLRNCPEFLACFFAAAKLGLIFVPLNFRLVSRELEYQINKCSCRLLVFHDTMTKNIEPIRTSVSIENDKFIYLRSNRDAASECPAWTINYHEAIKSCPPDEPASEKPIDLDDPLAILYTSGVSGDPKGAVISHGQTYFKNFQIINYTDMREDDIFLSQAPLCHSAGLCGVAIPVLCRGATLIMRLHFDPSRFASDIEEYRGTIIFGLTTMFRFILKTGMLDHVDVSSVRVVFGGGEKTPETLYRELAEKGLYLQTGFGQTENSAMVLMPEDSVKKKQGSVGLPNFFSEVWIQDKQGEKLPPGKIGEIVATGPNVMSGYWNMPEETKETIIDGVLHTGDLGYTDEEGFFYIVGRDKDMYRSGAENVYPAEVEKILADHPKVDSVSIIGVPNEKWGETGMAFIVCQEGVNDITLKEVIRFLDGKVARFKFPTRIKVIDSLPTTAWGKVKKAELKKKYVSNPDLA